MGSDFQCVQNCKHFVDFMLICKIVEKVYVQNIVERGQIYFGLLKNYREMEQRGKSAVGDSYEAAVTKQIGIYLDANGQNVEIHGPNAGYSCRVNANQCAFSLYLDTLDTFEKLSENKYQYIIPYSVIDAVCKDKGGVKNCAIITFGQKTVKKIHDALKERQLQFEANKVIYDNFDYTLENMKIGSPKNALECCFHKDEKYAYQKEFRIAVLNVEDKPIDDLFIPVDTDDFQVIELEDGFEFQCLIDVDAETTDDMQVDFKCTYTLKAVIENET